MLQKISDRIQGWVAGVIVAVIAAVFGLWGIEYYITQGPNGSKPVATVDGQKITEKQLKLLTRQIQQRVMAAQPNTSITVEQQKQIQSLALQQLISKTALLRAATKAGFNVSQLQAQRLIMVAPEFQVNGLFSPQRFQQFLLGLGMSEQQFLEQIQSSFILNQVSVGLEASAFALPNELKRVYQLIYQKRSFGYFVLPLSKFLAGVTVMDKEIQQYYQQNKEAYKTPARIKVSYLLLSPDAIEKTIKVSQVDLKAYYKSNKTSFSASKQWKIMRIMVPVPSTATPKQVAVADAKIQEIQLMLKSGQPFVSLMKQTDLKSSVHVLTSTTAPAPIANILAMLKLGQVSDRFHTGDGINLIKLISITPEKTKTFDQAKGEIQKRIARQRAQQILSQKSDELSNLTYTNPNTLSIAAKQLGLTLQTSPWVTKAGLKKGLFANHKVISLAFSNDVLQEGNNSNLINLPDGSLLVLRVSKHQPSKVQSLSDVRQTIQTVLKKNKAESEAGLQAYQISTALASGNAPQTLAKRYGLRWVVKSTVKRNNKATPAPILTSAFLTSPAKDKIIPGTNTLVMANGDYIVLMVKSAKLADLSLAPTGQLQQLQQELVKLMGGFDYRLYGKSVMGHSKVKMNK